MWLYIQSTKMSSLKLSAQDKRDLEKFTRFLALKATQIIVQSRSGEKVNTKCKPNSSGTDWFNLAIHDLPEVLTEAKRVLSEQIINSSVPLCIEISLRTIEGDTMILEMWTLGVLPENCDPTVRVTYTVYNRMGILLKSLLSVSRATPAYKLSHRQGPDSYVVCYRIFMGEPHLHSLGDNYKHVKVGQLCTPAGMIHLSVSYRTKMTISPTQTDRDSIMLKSDHFHSDLSPRYGRYNNNEDLRTSSDTIKVGAFVVNKHIALSEERDLSNIPFSSLLTLREISTSPAAGIENTKSEITPITHISRKTIEISNRNERFINDNITKKSNSQNGLRGNSYATINANDDFILLDLKMPFAVNNTNSDLGTFYRECQSAPVLQTFMEDKTLAEQLGDITKQLEAFETNMFLFDNLIKSLCMSENNN